MEDNLIWPSVSYAVDQHFCRKPTRAGKCRVTNHFPHQIHHCETDENRLVPTYQIPINSEAETAACETDGFVGIL